MSGEVMQTLDVAGDSYGEDTEDEVDSGPPPWGWLFPQTKGFVSQDMIKGEYTFGRGDECDHRFVLQNGGVRNHFMALSNLHFRIYRETDKHKDSEYMVIIEDKSSNGTFVNGEKIGKNKKQVLNSDDEISLSYPTNKAFVFFNHENSADASNPLPQAFKDKYILSKFLGKGACGVVRLAYERGTCTKFAVKIINKKGFSVGPLGRSAAEEAKILKSIQHPCIIRIQDVYDTPSTLYMVLELAEGGELLDRVAIGRFPEQRAKLFFYQLLMAIKCLHDRGITHRDIKPENILMASSEDETLIKVTDFGLSRFVGENSLMKTLCGTPSYLAPEIIQSVGTACGYSKAVDLWSVGVILFIMLAGYPPFSDEIVKYSLKDQILNARYSFPKEYWGDVTQPAKDMVQRLLTLDPESRITVSDALSHPWLQDREVVGKAEALMEIDSLILPPPVPGPSNDRKRPATSFDDVDSTVVTSPPLNLAKRPNLADTPPKSNTTSPISHGSSASPKTEDGTSTDPKADPKSAPIPSSNGNSSRKRSTLSVKTSASSED